MTKLTANKLDSAARLKLAKERTEQLVDHMIGLIALDESNKIVLKSDVLTRQIPTSYAAHAFNNFRLSMAGFEVVRLCACWEKPDLNDASIPNVVDLIDRADVRQEITNSVLVKREFIDIEGAAGEYIARDMANAINERIDKTIMQVGNALASPRLRSVLNHRHKYFAHNLIKTREEEKSPVAPMKNGDFEWLFDETKTAIDNLHHGLNRAAFDWAGSHSIGQRQAELLWHNTRFVDLK